MAAPGEGRMGIATAASVIGDMVRSFSNLRFILLVGIAGGVPTVRDVRLGDVVVGVPAYSEGGVSQYDFDVSAQDAEFKQKGHLNAPHEKILAAVRRLKATHITTGNGLEDRIATAIAGFRRGKIFSRPTTDMLYKASYTHPRGHGADLVLLVGWKDGEAELKLKVRRAICKGKNDRQPEHIMPERISSNSGPPPLYSQPMLFWLANMISSKVIKGNPSLQEILQIVPQEGRNHRILSFADDLKDHPVFPMWTKTGSEHNARSSSSVSQHISDWAKRAGFVNGIGGLHSARREALVKANGDNGQSVEQLQLFADHRNSSVLQRHYLGAMNTVDGVASYLGMDIRRDLTEDFRSATMKWDSDLALQLPAREVDQLKQDEEYIRLKEYISTLNTLIDGGLFKKEEHEQHIAARKKAYEDCRRHFSAGRSYCSSHRGLAGRIPISAKA
ncbi:hypothetical protein MGG_15788 [Pyricularia oryzae 70-15]|uniref:Nucleoside phosphorylase domain-containing protein n=1 Tax=Pyricularia oryzae (strain 70-15 / ATCC MYA-4617 / FGSC 8958) TaxID=242507 RepID=G4MWQ9_PYRO7|nr:uncharacterized protein MGG_15788 [Pyricularia oryzae 70-15]EHA55114.1 hypothetical protein MGG_15788 [Pyricularia oryzae 70-15]